MHLRARQLRLFKQFQRPVLSVTAPVRMTDPRDAATAAGAPVSALLVWALAASTLSIPQLRYRLSSGGVYELQKLTVSFTVLGGDEQLRFAYVDFDDDVAAFARSYRAAASTASRDPAIVPTKASRDYVFVSIAPWMSFLAVEQPYADRDAMSTPSMVLGRLVSIAPGQAEAPVAIQVHHGLVDGLHLARFFEALPNAVDRAIDRIFKDTA